MENELNWYKMIYKSINHCWKEKLIEDEEHFEVFSGILQQSLSKSSPINPEISDLCLW